MLVYALKILGLIFALLVLLVVCMGFAGVLGILFFFYGLCILLALYLFVTSGSYQRRRQ